jgi:hypothetical protein
MHLTGLVALPSSRKKRGRRPCPKVRVYGQERVFGLPCLTTLRKYQNFKNTALDPLFFERPSPKVLLQRPKPEGAASATQARWGECVGGYCLYVEP